MTGAGQHPVVVCYRGPDSSAAVQLGALLARVLHEPVALASAYRYDPVTLSARALPSSADDRRFAAAEARIERATRLVPAGIEVHEHVLPADDIPAALVGLARDVDACCLVLARDLEGHVTRSVVHRASCPVAVSPFSVPLPGKQSLAVIGVAYDDSAPARLALAAGMHLAILAGARLELIAVSDGADGSLATPAERAAVQISEAVDTTVRVPAGRARAVLVELSEGLDLLVCGSHGRGRAMAAVLGSVSGHLVRAAPCPVLVIPQRVRRDAGAPLGVATAAD